MVVYTNSLQVLIDDFFVGKLTVQEYVDLYYELYYKGKPIETDGVYSTIWLSNDEYCPAEDRTENDIDENELKAQIKIFLEFGTEEGYRIFHKYGGNQVAKYCKQNNLDLTHVSYKKHPYDFPKEL